MRLASSWFALVLVVLAVWACSNAPVTAVAIPAGCNPIGAGTGSDCLLPYPSDVFRVDGKVTIPVAAQVPFKGTPADLLAAHPSDGFPIGSPILALFPLAVDDSSLVFWTDDVTRSREPSSPTVLLDASTGERILHFAEMDPRAATDDRRALIIRPLVRLKPGTRYIVAIHGLRDKNGRLLDAPAGFASLRDDLGRANPVLTDLSPHFEDDVFPTLEAAGIARETLELAWDFTTTSETSLTKDMLDVRSDVLSKLAFAAPNVTITKVEMNTGPHTATRIQATVTVPLYLDSADPGGRFTFDATGKVTATTTTEVPFTVWIPPSVASPAPGAAPARLMQYGHGFFGDRTEVDGFPMELADEKGFVIVAADWWGLSKTDQGFVAGEFLSTPNDVGGLTDRVEQAMANFMYVAAAAKGPLALLPDLQVGGATAYDASHLYYYGVSMGGILGGVYTTLSPFVERTSLSVSGADWSMMLFRSRAFLPFLAIIALEVQDPLDQQKIAALLQASLERVDPLLYAPHLLSNRLAGNPSTMDVAMQIGLADESVPNVASYFEARVLGIPVLAPAPISPAALIEVSSPAVGSGMTLFDFGATPNDKAEAALEDNMVHNLVREADGSKNQIDLFFRPGAPLTQTCGGVCRSN